MKILKATTLTLKQEQILFQLWNEEYPEKICYNEIFEFRDYLKTLVHKNHYLLINEENQIVGWAFSFIREDSIWFGIIINSKIQKKGLGKCLLEELKSDNAVLNGWVIDHQNDIKKNKEPYYSPIGFYKKNGFKIIPEMRLDNDKLAAVKIFWSKQN